MEAEVLEPETQALEIIQRDILITRAPQQVLDEAKLAAVALQDVISKKKRPVVMNGEQYLEFEDWQTLGRFYGVTAKIRGTAPVDYGEAHGFEAYADAVRADGMVISSAESMCMDDESNWKGKPAYQLRSMAQTRACAKVLRNVLAWVVVLAGYKTTPAEEMSGVEVNGHAEPAMRCPECGGQMWDNRATKKGKQPDYKCKDKSCNKAVWLNSESKEVNHRVKVQAVADAFKLLNQAGDVPIWTSRNANEWVAERFEGAEIDSLDDAQVDALLKMLSDRLDALKSGIGDERKNIIDVIKSNFDSETHLANFLKGRKLEDMTVPELKTLESEVVIPF